MFHFLILSFLCPLILSLDPAVVHFTIERRGGAFPVDDLANLTFLSDELANVAARFNLTTRVIKGNNVVRKAKAKAIGGAEDDLLMGEVGASGVWYGKLRMGEPQQTVEMDLDMLTSDFFIYSTTSRTRSSYIDFFSQTYVESNDHPFPRCGLPSETVHLPTVNTSLQISFAHCRPSKSSLKTLQASGAMLGLAASTSLSQTKTPSLLKQLVEKGMIERDIWSLLLINGREGVFSVGGTAAEAVEMVDRETREELDKIGELERQAAQVSSAQEKVKRDLTKKGKALELKRGLENWSASWKWSKVQGADGWWQILMQGVWTDGSRVLKNQPVILDLNTPFILAPPLAAKTFYSSISGSKQLSPPYDQFYVFPCLNPPTLEFEFAGWRFPVLQGARGDESHIYMHPGGKFSLGRLRDGSGYCVGAVVETRMGVDGGGGGGGTTGVRKRARMGRGSGLERGMVDAGNGLMDVWVLGERFFRSVGTVFDFKEKRVGLRTY